MTHKVFAMQWGKIYPMYVAKVERKDQSEEDLLSIIQWLTGYSKEEIKSEEVGERTLREFFDLAPALNEKRDLITGSICGVKVQEVSDPLMKKIRQLDKIVDELAKGKALEKICRP